LPILCREEGCALFIWSVLRDSSPFGALLSRGQARPAKLE
jgi:hypothetical protein